MPIQKISEKVEQAGKQIRNLTVAELKAELASDADLLLLDIREIQERVDGGTIAGSKLAPRGMLEFWADPESPYYRDWFQEDRRTILFCASGLRSALGTLALQEMGFTNVAHLAAGFSGWKAAGEPIEDAAATSRWVRRS